MPLASVANLASILGATEDRVRAMLGRLRRCGWVASVLRGMTERRQHRFFLTRQAVDLLYANDHPHPSPRERAAPRVWPPFILKRNCPRTSGNGSPRTTTIPPAWRTRRVPPSPASPGR